MLEYGIYNGDIKEKELISRVTTFLEAFFAENDSFNVYVNNKVRKTKNRGGADDPENPEATFVYDYSYDYFNKYFGVYLMIYGNKNKEGTTKYSEDIEWIISISKKDYYVKDALTKPTIINEENPQIDQFVERLLTEIGVNYIILNMK